MPTFPGEIIREARHVARLQAEARLLNKLLREITRELRERKRTMTKLIGTMQTAEQMPPRRVFGEHAPAKGRTK